MEEQYSLYQSSIIEKLRERDWFTACIGYNFVRIAQRWNCSVTVSERRLRDAYGYWKDDEDRTLSSGIDLEEREDGTPEDAGGLDHFKHAAFIAFWLRRRVPINEIKFLGLTLGDLSANRLSDKQRFFLKFGDELCAWHIGLQLCLHYQAALVELGEEAVVNIRKTPAREYLSQSLLPDPLLREIVTTLKHKNNSPHGMYIMYRALFSNLYVGA